MSASTSQVGPVPAVAGDSHRRRSFGQGVAEMFRTVGPPFFIGMAVVVAIASAIGSLLTNVFDDSALVRWDERVVRSLEENRTPRMNTLTEIGSFIADPIPVAVLWGLAVIVLAVVTRHWRPPLFVMVAIGGEKLSYLFTTLIVDRPRPEVETLGHLHVTSSYPSGHTGSAVSLYAGVVLLVLVLVARHLRPSHVWTAVVVGLVAAVVVGYSRTYRGHHFPTDVVAGTLIGAIWIVIAYRYVIVRYLADRRRAVENKEGSTHG